MTHAARTLVAVGAALAFTAVGLGAFGAHTLKGQLTAEMLGVYQTAVQYHLPHAIGVVVIGLLVRQMPQSKMLPIAGWVMCAGVVVFSGSLYALSISGVRVLGAITPIGGVALLAAWAMVAYAMLTSRSD